MNQQHALSNLHKVVQICNSGVKPKIEPSNYLGSVSHQYNTLNGGKSKTKIHGASQQQLALTNGEAANPDSFMTAVDGDFSAEQKKKKKKKEKE